MCRTNPVTQDHIVQMKDSLLKRLANPNLSDVQRTMLQAQYDYVLANIKERPGGEDAPKPFVVGI